jgi:hypothetical protein
MKYFIPFIFLFLLIYSNVFSQIEDYYLGENIKERVIYQRIKEIKGEGFKFSDNKIEKEGKQVFLFGFDSRGNLTREQLYQRKKEKTNFNMEYVYNNEDVLIATNEFNPDGKLKINCKYVYDKGKLFERLKNKPNGKLSSHIKYKYNANNLKIAEEWYNHKGTLYEEKKFEYDEAENLIEEIHYNDDGSIGEHYTYEYDANKKLSEKVSLYSDGSIYDRWLYKYDDSGKKIEEQHFFADENPECILKYLYDENQNVSEIKLFTSSGKIFKLIKYTYLFYVY